MSGNCVEGLVRMSRQHATFQNRQVEFAAERLSGNDDYQGARKAQHPDDSDAQGRGPKFEAL